MRAEIIRKKMQKTVLKQGVQIMPNIIIHDICHKILRFIAVVLKIKDLYSVMHFLLLNSKYYFFVLFY